MRILATVAFSFAAATLLAVLLPYHGWHLWCVGGLLVIAILLFLLRKLFSQKQQLHLRLLLMVFSAAAALLWFVAYDALIVTPVSDQCGQMQKFSATVTEYPIATENGAKITVSLGKGAKAIYYGGEELLDLHPGQVLSGNAYWQDALQKTKSFATDGVHVLLYGRGELQIEDGSAGTLRWLPVRALRSMREQVRQIWTDETTAAFVLAMLTGERSELSTEDETAMSEVGLSHLFAVSGLHCAFLVTLLGLLLPKGYRRLYAALSITVLGFYMLMLGLTPSVVRSCIMLIFALLAPLFLRDSDPLTSMGTALLVILLCNPYAAGGISLQLSFAATLGILLCSDKIYRWAMGVKFQRKILRRFWSFFAANISASLGALVLTVPLTAYYFNIFTPVSPLSNLLVVPAAGWAFMLSFVTVLLHFVWPAAAQLLEWPVGGLIHYALWVARTFMRLPFHALYFSNPYLKYWLIYAYVMLSACLLSKGHRRKYALFGVLAALSLALTVWLGALQYRYGELSAMALDVGQGASILLQSGRETVLVDCGSSNTYIDAGDRAADEIGSRGLQKLTAVAVTHYHADHTNGLRELFARVAVETLYLPRIDDEYGVKEQLLEMAEQYGMRVCYVDTIQAVPLGGATLRLYPPLGEGDLNEQGLTVLCSAGDFDLLITGDMAGNTELLLTERYDLPDVEALVVSHHGSKYSTDPDFLKAITPETALISVGDNSYGHPSDTVLVRLAGKGIDVYRTDLQGNILLTVHRGEETYGTEKG
ncbi:MAG: MBL fold metallo-hydrolase [Ruminococcaceae bacterium]|nr:MBL fold metallo-hydrolase [Oscillospiraceae bacterium]